MKKNVVEVWRTNTRIDREATADVCRKRRRVISRAEDNVLIRIRSVFITFILLSSFSLLFFISAK